MDLYKEEKNIFSIIMQYNHIIKYSLISLIDLILCSIDFALFIAKVDTFSDI